MRQLALSVYVSGETWKKSGAGKLFRWLVVETCVWPGIRRLYFSKLLSLFNNNKTDIRLAGAPWQDGLEQENNTTQYCFAGQGSNPYRRAPSNYEAVAPP